MLTIQKLGMTLTVPAGAFKEHYSQAGWTVVGKTPAKPPQEPDKAPGEGGGSNHTTDSQTGSDGSQTGSDDLSGQGDVSTDQEEATTDQETLEKMSDEELKQYASLLGIKTKSLKSREQILQAIMSHQQ